MTPRQSQEMVVDLLLYTIVWMPMGTHQTTHGREKLRSSIYKGHHSHPQLTPQRTAIVKLDGPTFVSILNQVSIVITGMGMLAAIRLGLPQSTKIIIAILSGLELGQINNLHQAPMDNLSEESSAPKAPRIGVKNFCLNSNSLHIIPQWQGLFAINVRHVQKIYLNGTLLSCLFQTSYFASLQLLWFLLGIWTWSMGCNFGQR